MEKLLFAIGGATNVQSIFYNQDTSLWTIKYRNGLNDDYVQSEDLIDFLLNA